MGCERAGYAYTCRQLWPNIPDRWCNTCFERFGSGAHPRPSGPAVVG